MYNVEVLGNNVQVRSLNIHTVSLEVINILHQAQVNEWGKVLPLLPGYYHGVIPIRS